MWESNVHVVWFLIPSIPVCDRESPTILDTNTSVDSAVVVKSLQPATNCFVLFVVFEKPNHPIQKPRLG
jgi:hypothetical protein